MNADEPVFIGKTERTPLGILWVAVTERGLAAVEWDSAKAEFERYLTKRLKRPIVPSPEQTSLPLFELTSYLRGDHRSFSFPISARRLGSGVRHPLRRDNHLCPHRRADRTSTRLSRRRPRQCDESHAARHPLSPRDRHGRQTARLRRRRGIEDKGMAVEVGRRSADLT